MNIFLRELRANLKSLIIWSLIVVAFIYVGFSKFSAYYNNPEMLAILDALPPAMLAAFSMNAFNLTTLNGFYGVMITYFGLILGIAAAMWGSDIISKEERDRTVEFALTLPVTRRRVVTAKALAALVNCLVLLGITWGITIASAQSYDPGSDFYQFVNISIPAYLLIQLVFLSLGIFLGCAMKRYKRAGSLAVSILLGTYFAYVVSGMSKDLEWLKYFSPFKYFDSPLLLRDLSLDPLYVLLSLGLIIVFLVGAYFTYTKKDLYI